MPNSGRLLVEEINRTEPASPVLWWLGQCGFAVKYYGMVFYMDPRLDSGGVLEAASVCHADLILCTRAGHMHSPTLRAMLGASPKAKVVLPKSAAEHGVAAGVPLDRMTTTDSDLRIEYFKTGIYARVYAVPGAHPDLEWTPLGGYPNLGYLIRCGDITIYHAGDGVPYEGLADRLRPYNVKVALVALDGEDGGFTPEQAAGLAAQIGALWLVPMNYKGTPQPFLDHMLFHQPNQRFKIFAPGEGWQVPAEDPE